MEKTMMEIGRFCDTDKIILHGYHRFYPIFLEKLRKKPITMLEIGIDKPTSLQIWKEYFPAAKIYGIDIDTEQADFATKVFKGDQSDIDFLNNAIQEIGRKIDFIMDDGSHKPEHQLKTFNHLFLNLLKPGGIYIIEDIETNYWRGGILYNNTIEKGYKHPESIIEIFKNMIDKINEEFVRYTTCFNSSLIPEEVRNQIGVLSFGHNCVIIIKKDESYTPFNKRQYRFPQCL